MAVHYIFIDNCILQIVNDLSNGIDFGTIFLTGLLPDICKGKPHGGLEDFFVSYNKKCRLSVIQYEK